jgi:hypothetical protein
MAKLGIPDFETIKRVRRLQARMLKLLKHSSVDPDRYAGLDSCRLDYCGRVNCLEACPFGALGRRLSDVPAALRLLQNARPPFHEVRVSRALWSRPFGKLNEVGIAAARQLNRRALDRLYVSGIVAVGSFKVSPSPPHDTERWICEIHQVVAGVQKEELERALSTETRTKLLWPFVDYLRVEEVQPRARLLNKVLRCDLSGWLHPWRHELPPDGPTNAQRREFYEWLLGLSPRARLICYGCDRHFKKLEKEPRRPPPLKAPRKHPYPYWLEKCFFGSEERIRMGTDPNYGNYIGPTRKSPRRMHERLRKYFQKSNMDYYDPDK